ncbi:hypothetical protein BDZ94DRAFT_1225301 [Collybia nuda]|uniref:Fungal-type protein kinase domain-containing protein n=1 Tax=Collybia nuda TaxID=64659 RepID=A0A9P5XYG6_9AGAR|nr:hypothetical protein BDZ94DRAFT_1225301 [Collybia nuda]
MRKIIQPKAPLYSGSTPLWGSTRTLQVKMIDDAQPLILKASWPEITGKKEVTIIHKARLINSSPAITISIVASVDDCHHSTGTAQDNLGITNARNGTNPRIPKMMLGVILTPILKLKVKNFMKAWVQCYQCHYLLWKMRTTHGDVSRENLMWDPWVDKNVGVLLDFDLASSPDCSGRSGDRMGTVPYMARDILTDDYFDGNVAREYRHDLESFIWVLFWTALDDNKSTQVPRPWWRTSDFKSSYIAKSAVLMGIVFDKKTNFLGSEEHRKRWHFAVSSLEFLFRMKGREDLSADQLFREFEYFVARNWKWEGEGAPKPLLKDSDPIL